MAEYNRADLKNDINKNKFEKESNSASNSFFSISSSNKPNKKLKISLSLKLVFFRQLSVILQSGLPLTQGLDLLSENLSNKKFAFCIKDISSQLGTGVELSNAFKQYPKIFDPIVIGLIEAGEAGGILTKVLNRIALLLEAQGKLKSQITAALIYPVILLFLALTVSLALLIFIVPTFEELFQGLGAELPALTQFMLDLSRLVTSINFLIGAPIILFIMFYLFNLFYSSKIGRLFIDSTILKIPLFGDLITKTELASLSDTLSTLIESGLSITESLDKCIIISSNQIIKNTITKTIVLVEGGQLLSYSFGSSNVLPKLFISMVKIGEETGELSFMIEKLSTFYKREVDEAVTVLTKAMEPAVIFVVAGIVGTIVVSLYLPMFSLLDAIG